MALYTKLTATTAKTTKKTLLKVIVISARLPNERERERSDRPVRPLQR